MGDQQGPAAGVEEGLDQARQGLGPGRAVGRLRVAGGEDDQVGVELQVAGDLAGREQAVVLVARLRRRGEDQGGLRRARHVAGDQAVPWIKSSNF